MDLLIIKDGPAYLRISDGAVTRVGIDKASVFPIDQMAEVNKLRRAAHAQGFTDAAIFRLTLSESPLKD